MKYTPRLPTDNVNVSPGSPLKDLALMLGAAVAVVVGLYALLGLAVDYTAPRVSYDTELRIAGYLGDHAMLRGAEPAPAPVQDLARRIRTRATDIPFEVQVFVRPDDMVNAFALPGGRIVLTTGILDAIGSGNELAFILGHELGHIQRRDHLRGLGRGLVLLALSAMLQAGDSVGSALGDMAVITDTAFTRRQETLADEAGQDALMAVFGHAGGTAQFFSHLPERTGDHFLSGYVMTHPENEARIAHLEERARERGYPVLPLTPFDPASLFDPEPLPEV